MSEKTIATYTNGTAALKIPRFAESPDDAKIIKFPASRASAQREPRADLPAKSPQPLRQRAAQSARAVLDSSEMACSLRFESMGGCPYNLFTTRGIAALSAGASFIGVLSLILGS